jgi:hypothetical protein
LRRYRVHRIPHPTSVTIAIRPSCGGGMAESIKLFLPNCETKYFCGWDWTAKSKNCPSGKSVGVIAVDAQGLALC